MTDPAAAPAAAPARAVALSEHFGDRLIERIRAAGHPLCIGLDPHLALIPEPFRRGSMSPRSPETVAAVETLASAFLDRVAGRAAVLKPQIAFFEVMGGPGLDLLARLIARARAEGFVVILDAKRGDMGSTAAAYAQAYLGPEAVIPVDAMTVNPYLGTEPLSPFIEAALAGGGGLFVLAKTSNPGSAEFQDRELEGRPLYEAVSEALTPSAEKLRGPLTGWSSLGLVVGANMPEQSVRIRERLPQAPFLVPGYGFQGGSARNALAGFVPGPGGRLEGGFVSSSRSLLFPEGGSGSATRWERAVDEALDHAIADLTEASERS
jgi:orotidine-5'-phosphate decarboxylase